MEIRGKTEHCEVVEKYLETTFSEETDFHVICKPCHRGAKSAIELKKKKQDVLKKGRTEVTPKYLTMQTKRGVPSDVQVENRERSGARRPRRSRRKTATAVPTNSETTSTDQEVLPEAFPFATEKFPDTPLKAKYW